MPIDEKKEAEFNAWLDSIVLVDKKGKIVPVVLSDDLSDDPEGDRGEEEEE